MTTTHTASAIERARHSAESYLQPVRQNAFRLLGLRGCASQSEIYEAAASVRRKLKLGVAGETSHDAAWLGSVQRTENDVRDALGRLADPSQRIYERLFWFYEGTPLAPVSMLRAPSPTMRIQVAPQHPVQHHEAALVSLVAALHFDGEVKAFELWLRTLQLWKELVEKDGYWSLLVAADLKGDFEQLATYGEIRTLRARTMRLVTTPLAGLAKDGIARNDYQLSRRALAVLRRAALEEKLFAGYENEILAPVEDGFDELRQKIFEEFGQERWQWHAGGFRHAPAANAALVKFNEKLKPALSRFLEMAGGESLPTRRVFESAARGLLELTNAYRLADETEMASRLARKAWTLAPPESAAAFEIEEQAATLAGADWIKARTFDEYLADVRSELRPQRELFSLYMKPENLSPRTSAAPPSFQVEMPPRSFGEAFGRILLYAFLMFLCGLLGWLNSSDRRHSRNGIYLPPTYNYNYNMRLPPRTVIVPPINMEQLNLNLRTYTDRTPPPRRTPRRRTKPAATTLTPPDNTSQANQ